MQDRVTFEYAIIRLVPKVEREEFLNVGVILFSKPKKYLGIKYHLDTTRLAAFSSKMDPEALKNYLRSWKLICEGTPKGGAIAHLDLADRFRWLAAPRSTIIQTSKTHPGLCHNPQSALAEIFEKYVL